MSSEVMVWLSQIARVRTAGTSVLAVIAHPDEASLGLGAVLDAFIFAGATVKVLCLTHGQAWTLDAAPGDLASLRGAELASAADVLGPTRAKIQDCPDGALSAVSQPRLVAEVVAAADSCFAEVLLVFDAAAATGHLDHMTATAAALLASETLNLPVLGWTLSETVAAQLAKEPGSGSIGQRDQDIDLRVSLQRARHRMASRAHTSPPVPGSAGWSRLKLLADTQCLRWIRLPCGTPGRPTTSQEGPT